MVLTLTEIDTAGLVGLAFPDESGGMVVSQVVSQDVVGIPNYNTIFKYDLKG